MRRLPFGFILAAALSLTAASVLAQNPPTVKTDRGLTEDRPYTISYPDVLQPVDDGNVDSVVTLLHVAAPLQCNAFVVDGAKDGWNAETALANLDVAGIVSTWAPDFPGFKVTNQALTQFQSGPALLFEAESDNSPLGAPLHIVHAEATDGGRFYAIECMVDRAAAADARPMIDFIIANFSTRSDGTCCTDPSDPRG
jgi:hypothetical protein